MNTRETARHFGPVKALLALAVRRLKIRPAILLSRDAGLSIQSPRDDDGIRPATPADAELFDRAGFPGLLESKLADGPGWIKVHQGRLVSWCFLALTHTVFADWLQMRTDNPTALWGAGTWVHRDFRGSGVAAQIRAHSFQWYRDNGYRDQLSWIVLTNYSSRRSSHKLGAREIGRLVYFRLFGIAVVHDGRRWHLGRWTASSPLVLSIEHVRHDRGGAASDHAAAVSPSTLRRS